MSDILYRPNLKYEKDYKSDGKFSTEDTTTSSDPIQIIDPIEEIQNRIDRINRITQTLPKDIRKVLRVPLKAAQSAKNQINVDYYDPNYESGNDKIIFSPPDKKQTTNIKTPQPSNQEEDDFPVSIFSDVAIWGVKIEKLEIEKKIEKDYSKALSDIVKDYLLNLEGTINSYLSSKIIAISETASLQDSFTYNKKISTSLKDSNLMHVNDMIARIQIVKGQKLRMYKKLFTEEENITHIRACKVAKDLRQRYYSEEPCKNDSILDLMGNSMLENSKLSYDKKYKENLYNLYKYLNSSVILINECLNLYLQEEQAKAILLKEEGSNI